MNPTTPKLAFLLGSASFFTIANIIGVQAQTVAQPPPTLVPGTPSQLAEPADTLLNRAQVQLAQAATAPIQTAQAQTAQAQTAPTQTAAQTAAAQEVPEQVLVTGSLIHGSVAVGVPVTNLGVKDFVTSGALTTGELFRTIPAAQVSPGPAATINGGQQERNTRVNIRGLDTTGPRSLLMIDGVRFPPQEDGFCVLDPSIIPALAVDRIDVLADGASATYGSDAIAGVVNVVLKRNYDGAITLFHVEAPDHGGLQLQASALYGRTWDGGDVTVTYEWLDEKSVPGTAHSKYTVNMTPWGLPDNNPIGGSIPGTISTGKPDHKIGTVCGNCYAIPAGTGQNYTDTPAPAFDWSALTAGTTNVIDILDQGEESGAQQKNAFVATFDQRLFKRDGMLPGASFFFTGFYTNRKVEFHGSPYYGNGVKNAIATYTIPTNNPYYPTGVPLNQYGKLQLSFDLGTEVPPANYAHEYSWRYSFGFNLDLPFDWSGQVYDSRSKEDTGYYLRLVNTDYVQLALGGSLPVPGSNGTVTFTKPDSVPYLNLFCDPRAYNCNSPTTLNYITGMRHLEGTWSIEEKGIHFDGPLFDLPAGQIKAAVGGTYESDNVVGVQYNAGQATGAPPGTAGQQNLGPVDVPKIDSEPFDVWAAFVQVDVPIFGDNFNIPLFRKLDFEASWRHDQYSQSGGVLNGGTSNPKIGFTWLLDEMTGATVRGSWGTSFRFANLGESSPISSDQWHSSYIFGSDNDTPICQNGVLPPTGSASAALVAAGFDCNSNNQPGGIFRGGAPHLDMRVYTDPNNVVKTREGGTALAPEKSINYSVGFEIAPTFSFLKGLDLGATYYSIKLNGVLNPFNQLTTQDMQDPNVRFTFILPSDLGCPVADNANPTACAPFEKMVVSALSDFASTGPISEASKVYYLRDGATTNSGFWHVTGFDFNASYDWDMGDLGVWNAGITGTYYLHFYSQPSPGAAVVDYMHTNLSDTGENGVETQPRMSYRARLGWTSGPYSVTGFMNYTSHYYSPWAVPNNVPLCSANAGRPCYSYLEPSMYTFDLSLGYDTGDMPVNDYLKNIAVQLTFRNILDKHPAFAYGPVTSHRNAAAYDIYYPDTGRIIGLTVQKRW